MFKTILVALFLMSFSNVGIAKVPIKKGEKKYLSKIYPYIRTVWNKGVIVQANLLLKPSHPFNNKHLNVSIEMLIKPNGKPTGTTIIASSGNDSFDQTALESLNSIKTLPKPGTNLVSDDGLVHCFWTLKRGKPYSSVKLASIRFVVFPVHIAIRKFIKQGLIKKAWKRIEQYYAKNNSISKKGVQAFVKHFLKKQFPSDSTNNSKLKIIKQLILRGTLPLDIFIDYLEIINDPSFFKKVFNLYGSKDCNPLSDLLTTFLLLSEDKSIDIIKYFLINYKEKCISQNHLSLIDKSSWKKLKILKQIINIRKNKIEITSEQIANIKKSLNKDQAFTLEVIGLTKSKKFFRILRRFTSRKTPNAIKSVAIKSIGFIPEKKVGKILLKALSSKNEKVVLGAIEGILNFRGPMKKVRSTFMWKLSKLLKKGKTLRIKKESAYTLVKIILPVIRRSRYKKYLNKALRHKKPEIVVEAIKALNPKISKCKKRLIKFLKYKNSSIKLAAIKQLMKNKKDSRITKRLKKFKKSSNFLIKNYGLIFETDLNVLKIEYNSQSIRRKMIVASTIAQFDKKFLFNKIRSDIYSEKPESIFKVLPVIISLSGK
jgi:Gram-negative bacterial TonB protein C-terminal